MGFHGKSWDAMVIALFTKEIRKFRRVSHGKPWCASANHGIPTLYAIWESWDAIAITLAIMGNPINPWGIKWKT
jgi:hypothetical protein